jgi:hypothetical protein
VQAVYVDVCDQGGVDVPPPPQSLLSATRPRGGPWQPAQPFALPPGLQPPPNTLPPPGSRLISNGRGDLIVEARSADGRHVLVAILRDGRWSPVHAIPTGPETRVAPLPALAVNDAGEILVAWTVGVQVRAATRAADGSWTGPLGLGPAPAIAGPVVALNDAGDAVVSWARRLGPRRFTVLAADRRSGADWSQPREVVPRLRRPVHISSVALDAAGNAVAAYNISTSAEGPSPVIVGAAEHPAGSGAWTRRSRLGRGGFGRVAMDAAGTALAGWNAAQPALAVRPPGGRWRALGPLPGARTFLEELAVTPFGDVVVVAVPARPSIAAFGTWRRSPGVATWERTLAPLDFGTLGSPLNTTAGQGGDAALVYVRGTTNSLVILRADTYEAAPKPLLTEFTAPAAAVRAGAIRIRIGLSAPGRALVTISPAGRRRVVGAFFATVGPNARTIGVPARVRAALVRGRYTVTADSGGSPLAAARRTVALRVVGP